MAQSPAIARSGCTGIHPPLSSDLWGPMSATAPGAAHTVGESNAAAAKEYRRRRRRTRQLLPHCPLGSQRHLLHHRPAPLLPFQVRRVHRTVPRTVRRPRRVRQTDDYINDTEHWRKRCSRRRLQRIGNAPNHQAAPATSAPPYHHLALQSIPSGRFLRRRDAASPFPRRPRGAPTPSRRQRCRA